MGWILNFWGAHKLYLLFPHLCLSIFPSPQVQSERIHRVKGIHSRWLEGGGRLRSSDFSIMMWAWWLLWNIKLKCLVHDLVTYCIESKVAQCRHGLHDGTGGRRRHRRQGWLRGSRATWDIETGQEWRKCLTLILQTCKTYSDRGLVRNVFNFVNNIIKV